LDQTESFQGEPNPYITFKLEVERTFEREAALLLSQSLEQACSPKFILFAKDFPHKLNCCNICIAIYLHVNIRRTDKNFPIGPPQPRITHFAAAQSVIWVVL
jgi:hypothetical protein